jgi:hypothetical protein
MVVPLGPMQATPAHHGFDWTVLGVLLTAAFTGGIMLLTALAYRYGRREGEARRSLLYKFALAEILHDWLFAKDEQNGFQLRLFFQNTHDAPVGYEVESLRLRVRDREAWQDSLREAEPSPSGIVAPGLKDGFTLPPVGPFKRDQAPMHVGIEFVVKYGTVSHDQITFRWREKRQLVATLAFPIMQRPSESIPFTWTGTPTTESLRRNKRRFLRRI